MVRQSMVCVVAAGLLLAFGGGGECAAVGMGGPVLASTGTVALVDLAVDKPAELPNGILVKFREDSAVAAALAESARGKGPAAVAAIRSRYADLDVREAKPVFAGAPPARRKVEQALERLPRGKGKGAAAAATERRLRRLARAEEVAKAQGLDRVFLLELGEGDATAALARLRRDPGVEYAEPNRRVSILAEPLPLEAYIPDDRYIEDPANPGYWSEGSWGQDYPDLWGLRMVEGIEGMNYFDANSDGVFDATETRPGEGVIVAVIDTGVDYGHEDLAANIWSNPVEEPGDAGSDGYPGVPNVDDDGDGLIDEDSAGRSRYLADGQTPNPEWTNNIPDDDDENGFEDDIHGYDFSNGDGDPMDDHGHGTHCSGTIAARGDNGLGLSGIAPFATIMGVKGLSAGGSGSDYGLAQCVYYAANNGADVLSNSWGGMGTSSTLEEAFNYAHSLDIVSLAAAGNDNADIVGFTPANIENVISVAAVDHNKVKSDFSNWGAKVDVSAPGGDSYDPDDPQRKYQNILSCRALDTDMYDDGISIVDATYARVRGTSMACPHAAGVAAVLRCYFPEESQDEIRGRLVGGTVNVDAQNPAYEGLLGSGHVSVPGSIEVTPVPIVKILDVAAIDLWPGEEATVWVRLKNYWADVYDVTGVFSTDNPWATISPGDATREFGDLVTGATADNSADPIALSIDADAPYGATIEIEIALSGDNGFSETLSFRTTVTIFTDVGPESGLILNQEWLLTSTFGDYDNDGHADLIIENPTLFHNEQDGTFAVANATAGITFGGDDFYSTFFDINNDGHQDVYIGNIGNSQLFANDGDGTFTNISSSCGLASTGAFAAAALDFDGDGLLDLVNGEDGVRLYRNNGDLTFTEVTDEAGLSGPEYDLGMLGGLFVTLDYNDDVDVDLLFSTSDSLYLYRNNGDGTFGEVTVEAGLPLWPPNSVLAADYDNDGDMDIYLGYSWQPLLYRNNGDGTFTDVTAAAGNPGKDTGGLWTGCDFFDMDNDGDLDLHITNQTFAGVSVLRNTIWRNDAGVFVDATDLAIPSHVMPNLAAAAIGDYNNDGALDIYAPAGFGWGVGALLRNKGATANNYIRVRVVDETLNRDAYGARVTITAGGVSQVREVHTGAVQVQPLHFGIGDATMVDEIAVRWPGGGSTSLEDVAANQLVTVTSGVYPYLLAIAPDAAPAGNTVVLHGMNFGTTQGDSEVLFHDGIAAGVTAWSATEIVCVVPQDATTGEVVVAIGTDTTNGRHFEVIDPIRYASHTLVDDWTEGSFSCNGDGVLNPGERVALAVTLENIGVSALSDVTATLVFDPTGDAGEPFVTVDAEDNVFTFGTIGALSSAESNERVLVEVDAACRHGYTATFTLVIRDGSQNVWQDRFTIVVSGEAWPPELGPIAALDHAPSVTSSRYSPAIASTDDGHVYVAWVDMRTSGYRAVYFNHSDDFGETWQETDQLVDFQYSQSSPPAVCADEAGHVYVIWSRSSYIYINRSDNYGAAGSWLVAPMQLGYYPIKGYLPAIGCDEAGYVYATWYESGKIYFDRSDNFGVPGSWLASPITIMQGTYLWMPKLAFDQQGHVQVVAFNDDHVYLNASTDHGASDSWLAQPIDLMTVSSGAYDARIAADEQGHVYVGWRAGNLFYAISSDNYGLPGSWLDEEVQIDSNTRDYLAYDPQIAADNEGHVIVSWRDFYDIWVNASDGYGSAESLSGPSVEYDPSEPHVWENKLAATDQGLVHLVWTGGDLRMDGVYVTASHDAGMSWPAGDIRLGTGQSTAISADGDRHLYVAWVDRSDGAYRIRARTVNYNGPCTLDPIGHPMVAEGEELAIAVTAHSLDGEQVEIWHETSLLSATEQARIASATWDSPQYNPGTGVTTRVFRWTPTDETYLGDYSPVVFVALDSEGRADLEYVTIVVDEDCNGNRVADGLDLELGTSQDCNENGIPDECDIAGEASEDCDENGVPDECDPDCNANGIPDACDIRDGTAEDCNENGVPDECDLALGTSQDCNENGIPDECDVASGFSEDCNENGIPDDCDIELGISQDCSGNGIPDECEPDCNANSIPDTCELVATNFGFNEGSSYSVQHEPTWITGSLAQLDGTDLPLRIEYMQTRSSVAVTNAASDTVTVLRVRNNGTVNTYHYAVGDNPRGVVAGNLDPYGTADLAVVNSGSNSVSILLNKGSSYWTWYEFYDAVHYPVQNSPSSIAAGDFDGDSDLDLVVANTGSGTISVLLNEGYGTFADAVHYTVGTYPVRVETGDLDADGDVDVVVDTLYNYKTRVLWGAGDGTFGLPQELEQGIYPAVGDVNGDGAADVLTAYGTSTRLRLSNGDGTFADAVDYALGGFPGHLLIGDVEGDGDADVLFSYGTYPSAVVGALRNAGDGTFGAATPIADNLGPWVATMNFNNSGGTDVAVANNAATASGAADTVTILLNTTAIPTAKDCNENGVLDECDIDSETSQDCNYNNIPDECDIASGYSQDCNGNGVPDNCDIGSDTSEDCNYNGIPDECDIANGTSQDCNANGIADECEEDCNGNGVPDDCDVYPTQFGFEAASNWYVGQGPAALVSRALTADGETVPLDMSGLGDYQAWLVASNEDEDKITFVVVNSETSAFTGSVSVGAEPRGLVAADLNDDGYPDIAVVNHASDSVSIVVNTGSDESWNGPAPAIDFPTANGPNSLCAGDFDEDGDLDLAVANLYTSEVSFLANVGDATFASPVAVSAGSLPGEVVTADLDADTHLDLVVDVLYFSKTVVLWGNGDGTFSQQEDLTPGIGPALGDLDGDGLADVVVSHATNARVLLNGGDGTFADPVDYPVGSMAWPYRKTIHDLDQDGDADLVLTVAGSWDQGCQCYPDSVVGVLRNNGDGTFAALEIVAEQLGPHVAVVDLDDAGGLDLAVASNVEHTTAAPNRVTFFTNDTVLPTSPDCNGNGIPDECEDDCNGNGVPDDCDVAEGTSPDCNANGLPDECDIALIDLDEGAEVEAGASPKAITGTSVNQNGEIVPLDFDYGCGIHASVVVANSASDTITAVFSSGGGYINGYDFAVGNEPYAVAAGTLGNDYYPDVATVNYASNSVSVLMNNGCGYGWYGFGNRTDYATQTGPTSIAIGDVDEDGDLDLVVANVVTGSVSILPNDGTGGFGGTRTDIPAGTYTATLALGDLDEDGHLDIAIDVLYNAKTVVLWGNGDGTFASPQDLSPGTHPFLGDLDDDGDLDLLLAYSGSTRVLLGNGDGTFAAPVDYSTGHPKDYRIADLDGDGDADVVLSTGSAPDAVVLLLPNAGDGSFEEPLEVAWDVGPWLAVADFEAGGLPDLAAANHEDSAPDAAGSVTILYNHTTEPTSPDCNANSIPDECDIASGTSEDCNANGVPDECDIAGGSSGDCNANGSPDECEEGIVILGWRSVRAHDGLGALSIALDAEALGNGAGGPTTEPRLGGVRRIEVDFDRPAYSSLVGALLIEGSNGLSPQPESVSFVDDDRTLRLDFAEGAFVDGICYTIDLLDAVVDAADLGGVLCDADCMVRCLAGDANGDGQVTLADADLVDEHGGLDPDASGNAGYDVDTDGDIDGGDEAAVLGACGNAATCWTGVTRAVPSIYETIQEAIDAADDGDLVLVAGGVYTGTGNTHLDFGGKAIVLRGAAGAAGTAIDSEGWPVLGIDFQSGEGPDSVVDGFTIANGSGVNCNSASPTIVNCVIRDNYKERGGAVYALNGGSPTIANCRLVGNGSQYGGGAVNCKGTSTRIVGCVIAGNYTDFNGGGVSAGGDNLIANCTIVGNRAGTQSEGGGIACDPYYSVPTIVNCVVWGNESDQIGGAGAVTYCDVEGGYSGTGNLDADPRFVDAGEWDEDVWIDGDYRMYAHSAAIDAGSAGAVPAWLSTDVAGLARIVDGDGDGSAAVDVGAHEHAAPRFVPAEYATVQAAIDAATDTDLVYVSSGTYTGTGNKDLDTGGKAICMRGAPGSGVAIDCEGNGRGFDISSGEGPDTVIEGFTVLDGYVETSAGAGVYCSNSSPTIRDCTFTGGSSWAGSGILVVNNSDPTITNCVLAGNLAWSSGGGLYVGMSSHAVVSGCRIVGNESEGGGGGLFAMWTDGLTLNNCTISGNIAAGAGGGVFVGEDTVAGLYNSVVDDCSASAGAQLAVAENYAPYGASLAVAHSNVEGGTAEVYLSNGDLDWGEGNIDEDPLFADRGYWDEGVWVDGDYRLLASSPCTDAGNNALVPEYLTTDLDGAARIVDGDGDEEDVVDLGAYEAAAQQ